MLKIAFDIDDTLIIPAVATDGDRDVPNHETIAIYRWFQTQGCQMILWSGSGMDWAQTWGEKLGLMPFTVQPKQRDDSVDIAFDDCEDVVLAKVNMRVGRIRNNVSRKEWNKGPRGVDSPSLGPKPEKVPGPMDRCRVCGMTHAEHDTVRLPGTPVPRVPCGLLVSHFVA